MGGPHQGVAHIPIVSPMLPFLDYIVLLCNNFLGRMFIGPCGYIKSLRWPSYRHKNNVIADLNNEITVKE